MRLLPALVACAFLTGPFLHAETYYVRPDGNDASDGTTDSPAGAWRSIDRGQPTVVLANVAAGETRLPVLHALQFPASGRVLVAGNEIAYQGREAQALTGCDPLPRLTAGAEVKSLDWKPPAAGDKVCVGKGVYFLPSIAGGALSLPGRPNAAVCLNAGGDPGNPVQFIGIDHPIVDGRDSTAGVTITADNISWQGFEVRRGGMALSGAKNIEISDCRFHDGNLGLSAIHVTGLKVEKNIFYDLVGAWTSPFSLGRCQDVTVERNTMVSSRSGLTVTAGSGIQIVDNLIAWCGTGIFFDLRSGNAAPQEVKIEGNLIWHCGRTQFLHSSRHDKVVNYKNAAPTGTDLYVDPRLVAWSPNRPNFLAPALDSPCVSNGRTLIGAADPASPAPDEKGTPCSNLVFNPDFSAGLLGWSAIGDGESGIVDDPGRGAAVRITTPLAVAWSRLSSQNFHYRRGEPVTIRFWARAEGSTGIVKAGLNFPSWQNASTLNQVIKLTPEWKSYDVHLQPPDFFPDTATATFFLAPGTTCLVTGIQAAVGDALPGGPSYTVLPRTVPPGMILPTGEPLALTVRAQDAPASAKLSWQIDAPFVGPVASGECPLTGQASQPLDLALPPGLDGGIYVLRYQILSNPGEALDSGALRFSLGKPSSNLDRNAAFFGATPGYVMMHPVPLFQRQVEALAALGIGTLHLYVDLKRIEELLQGSRFDGVLRDTALSHISWLITPSDSLLLTGAPTWAPGPGEDSELIRAMKNQVLTGGRVTQAQLKVWTAALQAMATRYRGRIRFWEILNEPNTFLNGKEYAQVYLASAAAVRARDPAAFLLAGSVVNAPRGDLYRRTMELPPNAFDAFSYHPYRFGLPNPESEKASYRLQLRDTFADLKQAGHNVPVFLTEEGMGDGLDETRCIGIHLSYNGTIQQQAWAEGEILQAQYLARMEVTALGEGAMGYSYHTLWGLIGDSLMDPQLALKAVHTMHRTLGNAEPDGPLNLGPDLIGYLFKDAGNGREIAALWPADAEYAVPQTVDLPAAFSACEIRDLFGRRLALMPGGPGNHFQLGRELIYVLAPSTGLPGFKEGLEKTFADFRVRPGDQSPTGIPDSAP